MKNRRLLCAVCVILSALLLTGCQLAKADAGEDIEPDRLAGVFITREYLDLFDFEGYFEDNADKILSGGGLIDDRSGEYDGQIYATRKDGRLEFEGIEGMALFSATLSDSAGTYTTSYADDGVCDVHYYTGDRESSIEGTVYTTPGIRSFYMNPIYQAPDGSVYLKSGTGMTADGGTMTLSMDEANTVSYNGVKTTESFHVKVEFAIKDAPFKIAVVQMDRDNKPMHREEFDPSDVPDELTRQSDAAYIIVESYSTSPDGQEIVSRELADWPPDYSGGYADCTFTTYCAREDGICAAKTVTVKW